MTRRRLELGVSQPDVEGVGRRAIRQPAGVAAPPFDPTVIAGVVGWWPADSLGLADGAAVPLWPDMTGNGHDLAPLVGGGASTPGTFVASAVNGKPAVAFNRADNDVLGAAFAFVQPAELIFVGKMVAPRVGGDTPICGWNMNAGRVYWASATDLGTYSGGLGPVVTPPDILAFELYAFLFNGAGSEARVGGAAAVVGDAGGSALGGIALGGNGGSNGVQENSSCQIAEVIAVAADLSDPDRLFIVDGLLAKYAL